MIKTRRKSGNGLDAWPGYVDALSTLLMVIIFVLLVFVLAQAFMSSTLAGRNRMLDQLNRQVTALSDMLALETSRESELQKSLAQTVIVAKRAADSRDFLANQLKIAQEDQAQADAMRDSAKAETLRMAARLQEMDLEKHAAEAGAMQLQNQIATLNQQIEALRDQLKQLATALDAANQAGKEKDVRIADLGQKLNVALAAKVEQLQRYRSEFFGRLRDVLAGRPGIQIVGDRFVFQSEVLFPTGRADLTEAGQDQLRALATTLLQISAEIPSDLNWILRVDGHADRQPVTGGAFASNWELSAQRAINVVRMLTAEGVPPQHLAATAFADFQPLDKADSADAYARNRRIELRLTDR